MAPHRELVAHLLGTGGQTDVTPLAVLRAVSDTGTTVETITEELAVSRQTVYRGLNPLVEDHLIESSPYRRTGLGEVVLRVVTEAIDPPAVEATAVGYLAGTEHRARLLQTLREGPVKTRALAEGATGPSRSTVYRTIREFERRGWAVDRPDIDGVTCTDAGATIADAHAAVMTGVERALSRSAFLRHLDATVADIPLEGLAATEQFLHTPANPDPMLDRMDRIVATDPDRFRGFLSVVTRKYAELGDQLIRSGTETELIVPEHVVSNLPTRGRYALLAMRGLEATNFTLYVVPDLERLPVTLGLFDRERVAMGPPRLEQTIDETRYGSVTGTDPALISWSERLYERYRQQAETPGDHILTRIKRRIDETLVPDRGSAVEDQ